MLSVIIVGIDQFEEYTWPLIKDIQKFEPQVSIIVVDNASKEDYPEIPRVHGIRAEWRVPYAEAINLGIRSATSADWFLSMNNDVSCNGPFSRHIEAQEPDAIYARQIIKEAGHTWFGNWIVAIPRTVWQVVGEFDENFKVCGFEDADYSVRAIEFGFETRPIEMPFVHHWGKTRWSIPGYPATRQRNIEYFNSKHGWQPGGKMEVTHS